MTRALVFCCLCVPALADPIDQQRELNQIERDAANDEISHERSVSGDRDRTSLDVELRNQLGDDWSVKKSGNGYLATRLVHEDVGDRMSLHDTLEEFREQNGDARVTRHGDEVTLRGAIGDCGDAARAAQRFASIEGINRIFIDISCANR
jgi:hypothetical protein